MNDAFLQHIREGKVDYVRGDTLSYTSNGVHVNVRGVVSVSKTENEKKKPRLQSQTFAPYDEEAKNKTSPNRATTTITNGLTHPNHHQISVPQMKGGRGIDDGQGGRFTKKGTDGKPEDIPADIVVIATGFAQPPVDFLPADLFPEGFERPNLYLQNFSTEDWSVVLTNAAYKNAIGTV